MNFYELLFNRGQSSGEGMTNFERLFAAKLAGGEIKELEGIPPLTFTADGTPLLDYLISGNTVQSGTSTPDNPIMPEGTGERTGNLLFAPDTGTTVSVLAVSYTTNSSEFILNKNITDNNVSSAVNCNIALDAGTYSITVQGLNTYTAGAKLDRIYLVDSNNTIIVQNIVNNTSVQFTLTGATTIAKITFVAAASSVYNNQVVSIMLNSGSTALPYEPFGVKIPILSANTTTPVYLGEVQTTRKIRKLVLTGNETITFASEDDNRMVGVFTIPDMGMKFSETGYCNILQWKNSYSESEYNRIVAVGSTYFYMSIAKSALPEPTIEGFKAYLAAQYAAGTPVTIWYVLANEETAVVNEPLMKIGDYADTVSMEQAGVEIPTARGTNTLDVLTDVKPSEIYIKYKS